MKRCPNCGRFDVEFDPALGAERCLWRKCGWVNTEHTDIDSEYYRPNFSKFRASLRPKERIAV